MKEAEAESSYCMSVLDNYGLFAGMSHIHFLNEMAPWFLTLQYSYTNNCNLWNNIFYIKFS